MACNELMASGQALEAVEKYISPDFIEHDPKIVNGNRDGLLQFLQEDGWLEPGSPRLRQMEFHTDRILACGEFVVTHMHVKTGPNEPLLVFMDIYRVQNGKIIEHWDVMQPEPDNPVNTRHRMY